MIWQDIFLYLYEISKRIQFINFFKIISFLLFIPATLGIKERKFSIMNSIWLEERIRANISLIKNGLLFYIYFKIECGKAHETFIEKTKILKNPRSAKRYSYLKKKKKQTYLCLLLLLYFFEVLYIFTKFIPKNTIISRKVLVTLVHMYVNFTLWLRTKV